MADSRFPPPSAPPVEELTGELAGRDPRLSLLMLSWDLSAQLDWMREAGVMDLPRVGQMAGTPEVGRVPLRQRPARPGQDRDGLASRSFGHARQSPDSQGGAAASRPEAPVLVADDLEALHDEVRRCTRCALSQSRCGIALGNGVKRSDLMFVGERPVLGADGAPMLFADEVRALLDKMIQAMGLAPAEVACANAIQCASAETEEPFDAPSSCRPILWTQIALIRPKVIVALGKLATQTLLQVSTPITRLRGQWQDCAGIRLMPTYHPAYLLKHPDAKRQAWHDLQQVMAVLKG